MIRADRSQWSERSAFAQLYDLTSGHLYAVVLRVQRWRQGLAAAGPGQHLHCGSSCRSCLPALRRLVVAVPTRSASIAAT